MDLLHTIQSQWGKDHTLNRMWNVLLVILSGLALAAPDCPKPMALMIRSELCFKQMGHPTNTTLVVTLSEEAWRNACSHYNVSLRCIEDLVADCPITQDGGSIADSIATSFRQSISQLCDNDQTFQRYMQHAECYSKQQGASGRCLNDFSDDVRRTMAMDSTGQDGEEESRKGMCRAFTKFIRCVLKVITDYCGQDAAQLFEDLVSVQVPSHIVGMCQDQDDPYAEGHTSAVAPSQPPHGRHLGFLTALLLTTVTVVALLRLDALFFQGDCH